MRPVKISDWSFHEKHSRSADIKFKGENIYLKVSPETRDEWAYIFVDPTRSRWKNISWQFDITKDTPFRELAFNFRYRDFDNRYRYRFENNFIFFDKKINGKWKNRLGVRYFRITEGVRYNIRIDVYDSTFRCYVDGRLKMESSDTDIEDGSIAVILWETDGVTPISAAVSGIRAYELEKEDFEKITASSCRKILSWNIREFMCKILSMPWAIIIDLPFLLRYRHLVGKKKIIYALTPPPRLANIGDHAQAIAVLKYFKEHFPNTPVIELNKLELAYRIPALKILSSPEDIFFLHSGGNLGDRGAMSEPPRRLLIRTFTKNKIISLQQTIYFSSTLNGILQAEKTRRIYAMHPALTIIARDPVSETLAHELFPRAKIMCAPDFALLLSPVTARPNAGPARSIIVCLRDDSESVLGKKEKDELIKSIPYQSVIFDTTLKQPIDIKDREKTLGWALKKFLLSDGVVTDRYHGAIFAIICKKPCVILRTIDHKMTAGMEWLKKVSFVKFAASPAEVPRLLEECLNDNTRSAPDWKSEYFDNLNTVI